VLRALLRVVLPFGLLTAAVACARPPAPAGLEGAAPQRIVSLTPALTEILFAVGAGDRVVGVTQYCDYPPAAKAKPKVGGYVNPSVESVLALKPDLVLVSPGPGNRDAALAMQRAGLRLEIVRAETVEESLAAIEGVARIVGVETAGRDLAASVRARLDAVVKRVLAAPRVRTLFCVQTDPIIAAGRDTLPSQLLELAGGSNVVAAVRYPRLDVEAVAAARPELILQARMDVANGAAHEEDAFWKRWPAIPAVARGRVVVLPDDLALRPGPRVADAAEELAAILHGEAAGAAPR
jgi:ABC-type hemin transport system substrate-binding protein